MITRLILQDFRTYVALDLSVARRLVALMGDNGAGKTNLLEALSLFAPGRGLRRAALADIAHGGSGGFAVSAQLDCGVLRPSTRSGPQDERVMIGTGTSDERPGRRHVQVNGADSTATALGEWLAVGWLTPAMDGLFADSAGARRRYIDRLALALDPTHARHAARYEGALRERNRLLADPEATGAEPDPQWLSSLEGQLAEAGASLAQGRSALVERLSRALEEMPEGPFARPALGYLPGGPLEADALAAELARGRPRERAARRTLTGPHRDELMVAMANTGMPAASSSTGEQKAMLIALTLAHAELAAAGRPGVLLLDEVAAHLDPLRRAALFERLRGGQAQVWLTGTELAPFEEIAGEAAVWRVEAGAVERL